MAVVAYTEYPWDPRVRREAETLVEDGHEVYVIAVRPRSGPSPSHLGGVHLWEIPLLTKRGSKARYLYQYGMFLVVSTVLLLRLHMRRNFNLIHVHSLPDFQVFSTLPLKLWRVPVLLDLHEAMPEVLSARFHLSTQSLLFKVASFLEMASCRYADHIVVANDGIRGAVVSRGTPTSRITTIYNTGDVPETLPPREDVCRHFGLPNALMVVHAGGVNQERDLETLIGAAKQASPGLRLHVVIAGDGDPTYIRHLKRVSEDLGMTEYVHFLGRVPREQALAIMSLSVVGVVTLESNPLTELAWPTRIMEFTKLGKPLVVPDLRFLRSTLQDGAQYYTPGKPKSLAQAFDRILSNSSSSERSISKAIEVCSRFGWTTERNAFLRVFGNLVTPQNV